MARKKTKKLEITKENQETLNPYNPGYDVADLRKLRRTLAKRANQRMVRLERATSDITGESFASFGAIKDVQSYLRGEKRKRFSEGAAYTPKGKKALEQEIVVLQNFLRRKTSTVKGQKEIEKKRMETFEAGHWGTKWKTQGIANTPIKFASTKEFYDFLGSKTFSSLVKGGFTSEQIIEEYNLMRDEENADEVAKAMADALEEFREEGNASLQGLRQKLRMKVVKNSATSAATDN